MRKLKKAFVIITILFALLTGFQLIARMGSCAKETRMTTMSNETRSQQEILAEMHKHEIQLRKEKREDLKLYISLATTVITSLVTIILAVLNRKK